MKNDRNRGFTLVELMVVVVILGALIALVGPNVWNMLFKSRVEIAKNQMNNFEQAIDTFKLFEKKLPASLEDLTQTQEGNDEPYMKKIPADPWGNDYEYKQISGNKYELRCWGEDGESGTDDDITWPEEDSDER